jgi:hypothetical protein
LLVNFGTTLQTSVDVLVNGSQSVGGGWLTTGFRLPTPPTRTVQVTTTVQFALTTVDLLDLEAKRSSSYSLGAIVVFIPERLLALELIFVFSQSVRSLGLLLGSVPIVGRAFARPNEQKTVPHFPSLLLQPRLLRRRPNFPSRLLLPGEFLLSSSAGFHFQAVGSSRHCKRPYLCSLLSPTCSDGARLGGRLG